MRRRWRTYVILEGGLGNQLFEFAAAASQVGVDHVRVLEERPTPTITLTQMVPGLVKPLSRLDRVRLGMVGGGANGLRRVAHRALRPVRAAVARRTLHPGGDIDTAFLPRPRGLAPPLVFDGYFQHPDWYSTALPELADRLLGVAPAEFASTAGVGDDVVVVVRGGDYITLGWQLPVHFYERAMAKFGEPATFRVITDDPVRGDVVAEALQRVGWTRAHSPRHADAVTDFWAIAGARKVVIANSTFSWWAAVVGDRVLGPTSPGRVVVFPDGWILGRGVDLAHAHWRRVPSAAGSTT